MNTDKFYNLWLDFIVTLDGASVALLGIQLNLVAGTLAPYVSKRPDLLGILEDIVTFRISYVPLLHGIQDYYNASLPDTEDSFYSRSSAMDSMLYIWKPQLV